MGIVHGAAKWMPDLLEYFAEEHGNMTVKTGVMGKSDLETTTMSSYRYDSPTFSFVLSSVQALLSVLQTPIYLGLFHSERYFAISFN